MDAAAGEKFAAACGLARAIESDATREGWRERMPAARAGRSDGRDSGTRSIFHGKGEEWGRREGQFCNKKSKFHEI